MFLVICVVLDAVDGSIARRLNASTPLGAKLDTIADFVSFGILPSTVIYVYLTDFSPFAAIGLAAVYLFATGYRLLRFGEKGHSDYFDGIPSPFAASICYIF